MTIAQITLAALVVFGLHQFVVVYWRQRKEGMTSQLKGSMWLGVASVIIAIILYAVPKFWFGV